MVGKASRMRFRLAGAAVAALLMVSPVLSNQALAAQGSSDIDPDAAQALLADAEDLIRGVDPLVDDDSFGVEQAEDSVSGTFLTDRGDDIADFYLEYTVEAPSDGEDEPFDFGAVFRYVEDDDAEYRLIFASDDGRGPSWEFSEGTDGVLSDSLDEDVFDIAEGSTYDVVLAVIGDEAAFSINGEPIAILDVSSFSDPGRVILGSGFYLDTTVDEREVEYSNINLYVLDDVDSNGTATEEATEENGNGGRTEGRGEEETPTEEATEEPTEEATAQAEGDTYVSPTYGYSLTYDDTWEISGDPGTDFDLTEDGIDITKADTVTLLNGTSAVAIYGGESPSTAEECVQGDIGYYQDNPRYAFYSIAKDTNGDDLAGETASGDGYYTVIWVTDNGTEEDPNDPGIDTTVYIECTPIVDGESMLLIEHFAIDADYNDQIDAREALLAGLDVTGSGASDVTPEADETPETDVTPEEDETPTEEATGGDIAVTLDPVGTSDVDGEAVISSSGTTRSTIDVIAPTAPEGALVVVQEGSCDDLSGTPDFDAGSIDENGESSDRIRITPDELDGNYALTIVDADTEDYAEPLACGDIG